MKLKAKVLDISAEGVYVAIVHVNDAIALDIKPNERIRLTSGSRGFVAVADVSYSNKNVKPGEVGLFRELKDELGVKTGSFVDVKLEREPDSVLFIKKKLDGKKIDEYEINEIVKDILSNSLTEVEASYFIAAVYTKGLDENEVVYLTKAIANHGGRLHFKKKIILDKHCLGGLGGNRTTMVVVPIIAAAGYTIPKTSSRSISSPAGTADAMEVLAPVSFSSEEIKKIVNKTGACITWGGAVDLASTDDKLVRLRHPLSLDPEGLVLASILAKKSAADSTHVLIDIPVGKETKIKDRGNALVLGDKFVKIGNKLGLKVKIIITDGSQPIGNGVGPSLEARDVLLVLQNKGPKDLKEKSLKLAGMMLEMAGSANGYLKAREILESGLAYQKMKEIIKVQGGNQNIQAEDIALGKYRYELKASRSGKIAGISNRVVSYIAKLCGAPIDKKAGLYLHYKVGNYVKKGECLITFYAEDKDKLKHAVEAITKMQLIVIL